MNLMILKGTQVRLGCFICASCIFLALASFSQGKVVNDPGEPPLWIGKESFGRMIKARFKDSISGLDSMCFEILIDKKGKAKKVTMMEDFFAPKILPSDFDKISAYIKCCMKWKPAWVPSGKGIRNFECAIFEWVNFEYINSVQSKSSIHSPGS